MAMEPQVHVTLDQHDALPLLLQHSCINQDPKTICSLLCVCKAIRETIAQCRGQLPLECSAQSLHKVEFFAGWLKHWAGLARTLELEWNRIRMPDVEAHLRDALQAAAATAAAAAGRSTSGLPSPAAAAAAAVHVCTGALQIRSLKANVAGALLLGQLPPDTLTCLDLGHVADYAGEEALCQALARLTGLQSLTVLSSSSHLLLPATSALTHLTHACLLLRDMPATGHKLQHLPPQLRKLEMTVAWGAGATASSSRTGSKRPALQLSHVTALQELRVSGYLALQAHDELPVGLVSLQVPDCPAAQPLLHLTHLTTCSMYNCSTRAAQLSQLAAALPQLQEVSLGYFGAEESPDVDGCAPGWPGLPLRSLDFDSNMGEFNIGAASLEALGRLGSCLTQLALSGGVQVEATPTGLSQVLCRLTKLHTLRLANVELLQEAPLTAIATPVGQQQPQQKEVPGEASSHAAEPAGPAATSSRGVADAGSSAGPTAASKRASGRLTRGSRMRMEFVGPAQRVMTAIASLRSLRSLKLGGLTGWLLSPAAELQPLSSATQLTCLHIMDMDVSDDVIHGLVCGLTQLRELDVSDNACVGDGALGAISECLPLLRHLDVSGSGVSEGGIKALKQALPAVDVVCFQSSEEEWV